jgi:CO/xanthine dehydrogenase Mo-binding subunit
MTRIDARAKARGETRYVADIFDGRIALYHAAVIRSSAVHARILSIDTAAACRAPGVVGVFTGSDVTPRPFGRALEDIPVLATDRVRFAGERVAAVVATTREMAEFAAALVVVEYEDLPAVTTIEEAIATDAPLVHDEPWSYAGAMIAPEEGGNIIYRETVGSPEGASAALALCTYSVDETYTTQSVHQGYLEPQACIADYESPQKVRLWFTNKVPHRLRTMLSHCLGPDPEAFDVQPMPMGGDFGGKGAPGEAPLTIELSRLTGHPVKLVLRYNEDLIAGNPRHPSRIRVRMGCDEQGALRVVAMDIVMNGGAYGGCTPSVAGTSAAQFPSYRVDHFSATYMRVYTNTVPRGFMRAPGEAQAIFALESALDELAAAGGFEPFEFRRKNLLCDGDADDHGHVWVENRGVGTIDLALREFVDAKVPEGWLSGRGVGVYSRITPHAQTSLRLVPTATGGVCVEVPVVETGTGSHSAIREMMAEALGLPLGEVEIRQVSTDLLPGDTGVGGSRVTSTYALAADEAAKLWRNRLADEPVTIDLKATGVPLVGSYAVQVVQVAIDPATGQLRILQVLNAIDVANIINPLAHQMQIDGGTTMGIGYACLEDLDENDGHVWAANLGEYKLPSVRDTPQYTTVLLRGGQGLGTANVKSIGELTTPPIAAALANAIYAATGCRLRSLPLTAERIYWALHANE